MSFRRRAAKPSVALWMLVAIGDVALILASAGMVALIALASVVTGAVAVTCTWLLMRSSGSTRNAVAVPVRSGRVEPDRLRTRGMVRAN